MSRDDGVLTKSIWIDAARDVVRAFFTDAERHMQWSGVGARIDARPGGVYELDMGAAGVLAGQFLVAEADHLRMEIAPPGGAGEASTIDIRFRDEAGGTRLTIEHRGAPPPFDAIADRGWDHHLARLSVVCNGGRPGRDTLCDRPMATLADGEGWPAAD